MWQILNFLLHPVCPEKLGQISNNFYFSGKKKKSRWAILLWPRESKSGVRLFLRKTCLWTNNMIRSATHKRIRWYELHHIYTPYDTILCTKYSVPGNHADVQYIQNTRQSDQVSRHPGTAGATACTWYHQYSQCCIYVGTAVVLEISKFRKFEKMKKKNSIEVVFGSVDVRNEQWKKILLQPCCSTSY